MGIKHFAVATLFCFLLTSYKTFAQECYPYDTSVSLTGTFKSERDGSRDTDTAFYYSTFRPDSPICTKANTKYRAMQNLKSLVIFEPVEHLTIKETGKLYKAMDSTEGLHVRLTGYLVISDKPRSKPGIEPIKVEALDEAGAAALQGPPRTDCKPYHSSVTLSGTLKKVDEGNYFDYIVLVPNQPICTLEDKQDDTSYELDGLDELQIYSHPDIKSPEAIDNQLQRLVGHPVTVTGDIVQAVSGYYRTEAVIEATKVEATDDAGKVLLSVPQQPIKLEDVKSYDLSVHAGKRLKVKAWVSGTKMLLEPAKDYLSIYATGGWTAWLKCRDGYDMEVKYVSRQNAYCEPETTGCGVDVFQNPPIDFHFRCTKQASGEAKP